MRIVTRKNFWDDFFDDYFVNKPQDGKTDIYENSTGFNIDIEVPGFKKEEITVELHENILSINCNKKEETADTSDNARRYLAKGRQNFGVNRSYKLKNDVNIDDVKVKLEDGILKITILKTEKEISSPKSIMIE